ncbi:MAG: class I tRNA ligase family protein, partial [Acidobacteria bacterium]|nr:class I tRNA ligase family protein [Acidobacteriota bacterium]
IGLVSFNEPVKNLLTQGMVTNIVEGTGEWKAMSKSLGNGVDPDEMINAYGSDAVRLFILFAAPPENELRWLETGIEGAVRFLRRVYSMVWRWSERLSDALQRNEELEGVEFTAAAQALRRKTHQTIARISDDFEELHFNTSVAALMELSNALSDFNMQPADASAADVYAVREALEALTIMLTPFAPHISEEMWQGLGHHNRGGLLSGEARWPKAIEELAREEELEIPVQVNGKLRARIRATPDTPDEVLRASALSDEKVRSFIEGRQIVKIIVVPQRLVNVVVK